MCIVAGLRPAAAKPVFRERPYRSRNPPFRIGYEKTGRPPIRSRRYLSFGLTSPSSSPSSDPSDGAGSVLEPFPPVHLHLADVLLDFRGLERKPLGKHQGHPPLTEFVSIRWRFRYPLTSSCSVPSPSIQTGQLVTISRISSSPGRYWRFMMVLYCRISSMYRSISSSRGM